MPNATSSESNDTYSSTKKKLLNVSMHTFATKGYHATTIEEIANNCNIKKPSVFHYFDSKLNLVLNIVTELNKYCQENIFNISHHDPKENAQTFVDSSCQFFTEKIEGQFIALLGNELVSIHQSLQEAIQTYITNWQQAIKTTVTPFYENNKQIEKVIFDSLAHIQGCLSIYHLSNKQSIYLQQLQQRLKELWLP